MKQSTIFVFQTYKMLSSTHCSMHSDTILKKYSSTIATIFTGIASAALFGHTLTMNFILGISIVFISMHQVISKDALLMANLLSKIWEFCLLTLCLCDFSDVLLFSVVLFTSFQGQRWATEWEAGTSRLSGQPQVYKYMPFFHFPYKSF